MSASVATPNPQEMSSKIHKEGIVFAVDWSKPSALQRKLKEVAKVQKKFVYCLKVPTNLSTIRTI